MLTQLIEFLAVHDDLMSRHEGAAVFRGIAADSDLVVGLDAVAGPASPAQIHRVITYGTPVFGVALIVLHVEKNRYVRIG